jgi:hypothetical protein
LVRRHLVVPASGRAAGDAGAERLVDDGLDRARAATAFGATTEAAIDLLGVAGKLVRRVDGLTDIVIAKNVTGTDNHGKIVVLPWYEAIDIGERGPMQKEKPPFEGIPNCGNSIESLSKSLVEVNQTAAGSPRLPPFTAKARRQHSLDHHQDRFHRLIIPDPDCAQQNGAPEPGSL